MQTEGIYIYIYIPSVCINIYIYIYSCPIGSAALLVVSSGTRKQPQYIRQEENHPSTSEFKKLIMTTTTCLNVHYLTKCIVQ
jgi:hypothetical protein